MAVFLAAAFFVVPLLLGCGLLRRLLGGLFAAVFFAGALAAFFDACAASRPPVSARRDLASATLGRSAAIRSTTLPVDAGSSAGATTSPPATFASMTSSSASRYCR